MHAPGCAFHVTARAQECAHLFSDERTRRQIASYICDAGACSTTRVLAYAVMPNHLHMVLRQGEQPLGWMVQRVLQRTALLVRRTSGHQDHVFGRRYWAEIIDTPMYVRQAIIYTHLNPYRKNLCSDPANYEATSHRTYLGLSGTTDCPRHVWAHHALGLFASSSSEDINQLRDDYMRFIRYWIKRPPLPKGAKYLFMEDEIAPPPLANTGDAYWLREYGDAVASVARCIPREIDVHDAALAALHILASDLTLEQLRMGGRIKRIGAVRRSVVAILLMRGCRNGQIARCLNVSTAYVSAINAAIRRGLLPRDVGAGVCLDRPPVTTKSRSVSRQSSTNTTST